MTQEEFNNAYNVAASESVQELKKRIAQLTRDLDAAGADAKLGRALITSGLYDCMNDFETDAEATVLIKRLIAIAEPILDAEWNRRRALSTPNDWRD